MQKLTLVVEFEPFCLHVVRNHSNARPGSVALRKGIRRFCPHRSDRCRAPMLTCRNSPLWQCCEHCNNVLSSFWPPQLARTRTGWSSRDCALIGTSRKYNYMNSLERRFSTTSWWMQTEQLSLPKYPKGQSRTCYQECSYHLNTCKIYVIYLVYSRELQP